MIYVIATDQRQAKRWMQAHGMSEGSAVILTKEEDAQGRRLGSADRVHTLPGADPRGLIHFELSIHASAE